MAATARVPRELCAYSATGQVLVSNGPCERAEGTYVGDRHFLGIELPSTAVGVVDPDRKTRGVRRLDEWPMRLADAAAEVRGKGRRVRRSEISRRF